MNQTPDRPVLYTDGLSEGQEVTISWTSCGRLYRTAGPICKINKKSIRVTLVEEFEGYPAGKDIIVPIPGTDLNGAWYK